VTAFQEEDDEGFEWWIDLSLMITAAKLFLEPRWVYAFILLVPFLLLYLIKPKPRYQMIPTLMFLFRDLGSARKTNFLRRLITNLLFILQLLLMLCILISIAKPYVNVTKESLFKNTVIVLDVSASMKAGIDSTIRFDRAVSIAKDNLGGINTLILAKKTPEAVLVDESASKTKDYLNKLEPTDNPTNLYGAISAAGSYAKSDARIIVISDFIDTETDTDLNTIKKTLEAQGTKVDFVRVFSIVPNIGIVDLSVTDTKTTAVISNYNPEPVEIKLKVNKVEESLKIGADSKEVFTFTTPPGFSKLELELEGAADEFEPDNIAYVSAPSDTRKKVLLITNSAYTKTYLFNALDVMKNVEIDVAVPPKIPGLEGFDIFIFKDVNRDLILPGTFKGVKKEVEENGKAAIIAAQADTIAVDYQGLLPLQVKGVKEETSNILPVGGETLTSNIDFGITKRYFDVVAAEGKNAVLIAASDNRTPIITFSSMGNGKVLFYGILDEDKQAETFFGKSPGYYVFWKRTVDFMTNTPSIKNLNFRTGSFLSFAEEQRIETPGGKITTKDLSLDNSGMYTLKDRVIAINLINEKESDVGKEDSLSAQGVSQGSERFKEKTPFELTYLLIWVALALLMLELLYVKMRGDF
jgi:hypothetical protein